MTGLLQKRVAPALTALSENTYLSAVRAGMVAIVPLTIIGGLFLVVTHFPSASWQVRVEPHLPLLQVPVAATFGVLAVFACFATAFELARLLKQDALSSAIVATAVFLMIQIDAKTGALATERLGSQGLFAAILVALVCVRVQKLFADWNLVIRMPATVPPVVYESFLSLVPFVFLALAFWVVRFVLGVDINHLVQRAFSPLVFALNTLPGILVYALLVTALWSVGINGDNTLDAIVAPVFLQYLAENTVALNEGRPPPYVTANGFFSTFVNVGGTGATLALALLLLSSKEPGYRKVSRLSLPTQVFQINEPIFFGLPIVLNPVFMAPYVLSALTLTACTYLLMHRGWINRPIVNVPWTTPPVIGHYLVTGGDWRAAVWGVISIAVAMGVYYPFAKVAERQRLRAGARAATRAAPDGGEAANAVV